MNLNEIARIGYRKALEFLIKDYCIDKNKEEEKIKKEPLSQVIINYIIFITKTIQEIYLIKLKQH